MEDNGKQKSHGIHARFGADDMDTVTDLNLNRASAYTPQILIDATEKVEQRNVQARVIHWKGQGKTQEEAFKLAKKESAGWRKEVEANIEKEKKVRGY
jgi:hypothetical protein